MIGRVLVAAVLLSSCAPTRGDAFLAAFSAGERAYHGGRFEEAARAYDKAARNALRLKDRDEGRFLEARSFQRAERWHEARATLDGASP